MWPILSSLWTLRQATKLRNYRSFPLTKQGARTSALSSHIPPMGCSACCPCCRAWRQALPWWEPSSRWQVDGSKPRGILWFHTKSVIAGTLDPKYCILEVLIHSHIMFSHIHYAKTLQNQAWQCENSPLVDYWWLILENCEVCATCCVLFKSQLFWFNHLACCITMFHVHVSGEIVKCCWVEKTTGKGRSC